MANFFGWFTQTRSLLARVFSIVEKVIPEDILKLALVWVRVAAEKYVDNTQRREFVVGILVARGISESIARLAVELAVRIFKSELREIA